MWMRQVWVRFYKSFNYNYDLKALPEPTERMWEMTDHGWRPFVGVPLEPDITAVVGANESGKSHLLNAIAIVLTGQGLEQRDFCRYSTLFSVEEGKRRFPEVGATFALTEQDRAALNGAGVPLLGNGDLQMFRRIPDTIEVLTGAGKHITLNPDQTRVLTRLLPYAYKLDTRIDLPDSVSIAALAGQSPLETSRAKRLKLLTFFTGMSTAEQISAGAAGLLSQLTAVEAAEPHLDPGKEAQKQKLGRELLMGIAHIDQSSFAELQLAIAEQREGLVNGLIQEMNRSIARHLNIARWWTQDADFELRLSPREHELVFTIRDRTGTDYSFSERSRGLTYFLSYYVQLRSHYRPADRPEVLLMDEPDAYLSALGQQDLLRVLEDHARPEDGERHDQVVYVTHSPFLINRNAGHRVRVVDKGARDQGTRLVNNVTQTHYEPLRTSLGPSVAETAFIGGENLFVEGISDQVMLTAMNARLIRKGTPPSRRLDLNQVTIVPGGSDVAYMLYLARGRDHYKPACAVLLDSDKTGREAQKAVRRGGPRRKPALPDNLIVMLGDWAAQAGAVAAAGVTVEEPEDLVPLNLVGIAARSYARRFLGLSDSEAAALTDESIDAHITDESPHMWDAIEASFFSAFATKPGKLGLAKELVAFLEKHESDKEQPAGVDLLVDNYGKLLNTLVCALRAARAAEEDERRETRVQTIIDDFISAHPDGASRDDATMMLDRVDAATDNSDAGTVVQTSVQLLRRNFDLAIDPLKPVDRFEDFVGTLALLPRRAELTGDSHVENIAAAAERAGLPTTGTPDADPLAEQSFQTAGSDEVAAAPNGTGKDVSERIDSVDATLVAEATPSAEESGEPTPESSDEEVEAPQA